MEGHFWGRKYAKPKASKKICQKSVNVYTAKIQLVRIKYSLTDIYNYQGRLKVNLNLACQSNSQI